MNALFRNSFFAAAALLGATIASAAPAGTWPPDPGDLILGVQAKAGTGNDLNVFYNLGPAHTLRDSPSPGMVVDLNAQLTATFGAGWENRAANQELLFGVIACRTNLPPSGLGSVGPANGDPASTIYASRFAASAGAASPWSFGNPSALGIGATDVLSLDDAIDNIADNGVNASDGIMVLSQSANPVQWFNSWTKLNPNPGAGFSIFAGGIQAPVLNAAATVDLFRIPGTSGIGGYVTSITLATNGEVTANAASTTNYFSVDPTGTSNGAITGAGVDILYAEGSEARLTAVPAAGYGFLDWGGDASGSDNPLFLEMDANKMVTANFAPLPSVTTPTATDITGDSATLGGNVTGDGGQTVTERGVVYAPLATTSTPVLGGTGVSSMTAAGTTGVFTTGVTGLMSGTTYAYRGYATTAVGTGYTGAGLFTTDTEVTLTGGVGTVPSRQIQAGDTHRFLFTLAGGAAANFTSTGSTVLGWELRDSGNNQVAFGTGAVAVNQVLAAGDYVLSLTNGTGSAESVALNLDASNAAAAKPDVTVGPAPSAPIGQNVYSPALQRATIVSRRAVPKNGFARVGNDGPLDSAMKVRATRGNAFFGATYFAPGNVTAQIITGNFTTPVLTQASAPVSIRASIKPNKRKLVKKVKRGKRRVNVTLRRTFVTSIRANAVATPAASDTAQILVRTQ